MNIYFYELSPRLFNQTFALRFRQMGYTNYYQTYNVYNVYLQIKSLSGVEHLCICINF